jgi:16S rRNA (guanine1516-N2)-methyltransferase
VAKSTDEKKIVYTAEDLKIDFLNDHINYSRKSHRGKSEIIAKALGANKGVRRVLDLTCGLAQDAFFLAQIGFEVRAFERSRVLFEILDKALRQAQFAAPERLDLKRFSIEHCDSIDFLRRSVSEPSFGPGLALYLDPMFPEKKKSALPRKEMQIFRGLVGSDEDAHILLQLALSTQCERVVVKRPLRAEALAPGVVHSFEGTTVRYDLYSPSGWQGVT